MKTQIKIMNQKENSFIKISTNVNRLMILRNRELSWLLSCGYKGIDFPRRRNSAITKKLRLIESRLNELQK
jgi:hypothetical protein